MPTHRRTKSLLRHSPVSSGNFRIHLTEVIRVEPAAFPKCLTTRPEHFERRKDGDRYQWCGASLSSAETDWPIVAGIRGSPGPPPARFEPYRKFHT